LRIQACDTGCFVRNPADRFQVVLAMLGPFALLAPFFVSLRWEFELTLWLAVWLFVCRHNYILHNHVHRPFTRSRPFNRMLGAMLGFCTGMTAGNWKIAHVHGHHVEHQIDALPGRAYVRHFKVDESEAFSNAALVRHVVRTAPLQWAIPLWIMARESCRGRHFRRTFYRYHLREFGLIYGAVFALAVLNPAKAALYFGAVYGLVFVMSRHVDYVTHVASRSDSRYDFANVCLDPRYNRLLWNFGFHVAHHLEPRAHWTALPAIHRRLDVKEDVVTSAVRSVNYFGAFRPVAFHWHRLKGGETA
jgi:fatty acid desaturase